MLEGFTVHNKTLPLTTNLFQNFRRCEKFWHFSAIVLKYATGFCIDTSLDMLKSYSMLLFLMLYGYVSAVPSRSHFIEGILFLPFFYERWYTGTPCSAPFSVLLWQYAAAFYSQHAFGVITSQFLSSANIRDPLETCHLYHFQSILIYFLQGP